VLPTKYDPVRDAISDYGVGDYRRYFWAQLAAGALACICIAVALTGLHPYVPTLVVVLLLANAAARLLMPAFPTDQSGNRFGTVNAPHHQHHPHLHAAMRDAPRRRRLGCSSRIPLTPAPRRIHAPRPSGDQLGRSSYYSSEDLLRRYEYLDVR
jgi:uncharacterized protein DUF998